jgi:hypothetical protein
VGGIRQHGLLSTSALLDLFEIDGDLRAALAAGGEWNKTGARPPIARTVERRVQDLKAP